MPASKSSSTNSTADELKKWDAEFMNVDQNTLYDLILAANYLDIRSLLDLTCQTVANMIKGKNPEEIRKTFNIKNDFTPEEEQHVRKENQIQKWGISCSDNCVVCSTDKENIDHLLFKCPVSAAVWHKVLMCIGVDKRSSGFTNELEAVTKRSRKTGDSSKLYVMCFIETVYQLWLNKNAIVFRKSGKTTEGLAKEILFRVS
ncbi:hypothetical protein SOVF_126430, partial [Spinacia oleracea]